MKSIRALVDGTLGDFEEREFGERVASLLPGIFDRWRKDVKLRFMEMVSAKIKPLPNVNPLDLATVLFHCLACDEAIHYPAVTIHGCLNYDIRQMLDLDHEEPEHEEYTELAISICRRRPFSLEMLDLDKWSDRAQETIRFTGLNPLAATSADMDQADARMMCSICCQKGRAPMFMTWRTAVSFLHPSCWR